MATGWQDISTAPKDGTFVLTCMSSGHIKILLWCADDYWRGSIFDLPDAWQPTHWQPLPAPPDLSQFPDKSNGEPAS